jgi:hypothetical protein
VLAHGGHGKVGTEIEKSYSFVVNATPPALFVDNEDETYDLGSRIKAPVLEITGGTGQRKTQVVYEYAS